MSGRTKRAIIEGLGSGLLAGTIFASVAIVVAALAGEAPLSPIRVFASVLVGRSALDATAGAMSVVIVGGVIHFAMSAMFGLVYALVDSRLPPSTQSRWTRQSGLGIAYGVILWAVNYELVARFWYPWLLGQSSLREAALYALCFGLPLALICTGLERHARRVLAT